MQTALDMVDAVETICVGARKLIGPYELGAISEILA